MAEIIILIDNIIVNLLHELKLSLFSSLTYLSTYNIAFSG